VASEALGGQDRSNVAIKLGRRVLRTRRRGENENRRRRDQRRHQALQRCSTQDHDFPNSSLQPQRPVTAANSALCVASTGLVMGTTYN
jgi:hypothetical protein